MEAEKVNRDKTMQQNAYLVSADFGADFVEERINARGDHRDQLVVCDGVGVIRSTGQSEDTDAREQQKRNSWHLACVWWNKSKAQVLFPVSGKKWTGTIGWIGTWTQFGPPGSSEI